MTNALNTYLANLAVLQFKLHNLHWNVTGPLFVPVHEYTEKRYTVAFEQFDEIAEVLKMRGQMPRVTMSEYLEVATIKEEPAREFSDREVLDILESDMKLMQAMTLELRNKAAQEDDFAVQGIMEGYLADYAKELWFLRSMKK